MATLNLEDDNVDVFALTTTEARCIDFESDLEIGEALAVAMDEAQAKVFMREHEVSYLVIKITHG